MYECGDGRNLVLLALLRRFAAAQMKSIEAIDEQPITFTRSAAETNDITQELILTTR